MHVVVPIVGLIGLFLLWRRWPSRAAKRLGTDVKSWPKVSIIVPARNEAANLPHLIPSLLQLDYPNFEVIVVDDGSTDATAAIARQLGGDNIHVVTTRARPEAWRGKQWACTEGFRHASGDVLLFTDADTVHAKDSLKRTVPRLVERGGLLTCLPNHTGTKLWERLSGPFHVLMLTTTRPYGRQTKSRHYAIGQYLMFTRSAYLRIGGHVAVKDDIVEDLPLARACLDAGISTAVFAESAPIFSVRMYATLGEFISGWRRNIRAGLGVTTPLAPAEVTAMMIGLTGAGLSGFAGISAAVLGMVLLSRAQRRLGNFSIAGAVLWPVAGALFCYATLLAVWDTWTGRPVKWKDRLYPAAR